MNRRQILKLLPVAAVTTATVVAGGATSIAQSSPLPQPTPAVTPEKMSFSEWLRNDLKLGLAQKRADRAAGITREPESAWN